MHKMEVIIWKLCTSKALGKGKEQLCYGNGENGCPQCAICVTLSTITKKKKKAFFLFELATLWILSPQSQPRQGFFGRQSHTHRLPRVGRRQCVGRSPRLQRLRFCHSRCSKHINPRAVCHVLHGNRDGRCMAMPTEVTKSTPFVPP